MIPRGRAMGTDGFVVDYAQAAKMGLIQLIQPRNDRVLVRRIEQKEQMIGRFVVPDSAREKALLGEVVAVGPGKWVPGEWWSFPAGQRCHATVENGVFNSSPWEENREWRWIDGYRQVPAVRPGQKVYFNAKWNDFAGDYLSDLPIGHDPLLHLIQEGDIFLA